MQGTNQALWERLVSGTVQYLCGAGWLPISKPAIIILILHSLYPFTFCSDNPAKLFTIRTFFPSAGIVNVNPLLFSLLSLFLGGTLINGLGCRVCGRIHAECYNWPRLVSCMRLLLKVQIPDFWT